MGKIKNFKSSQNLNPENYIRQRARTLPIHECYVNSNWEENGLANIIVARKHKGETITFGLYLVDLFCLGVKDCAYNFSVSLTDFDEMIDSYSSENIIKIDYTLAHNIIYAGLSYADDLGFKPHKDFEKTGKYILDEDTDEVDLIDIECGLDGIPALFHNNNYSENQFNGMIKQLEKSVGKGNFKVFYPVDEDENDEYYEDDNDNDYDDEDDYEDEYEDDYEEEDDYDDEERQKMLDKIMQISEMYASWTSEKRHQEFYNLHDKPYDEDQLNYMVLLDIIYKEELVSDYEVSKFIEKWHSEVQYEISEAIVSESLLGIDNAKEIDLKHIESFDVLGFLTSDKKKQTKTIKSLEKVYGDIPYISFLKLYITRDDDENHQKLLLKYYNEFPNYPLIKFEYLIKNSSNEDPFIDIDIKDIFTDSNQITETEMLFYQLIKIHDTEYCEQNKFNYADAIQRQVDVIQFSENARFYLAFAITYLQKILTIEYLLNNKKP